MTALAKEAAAFKLEKKTLTVREYFVIERDGPLWRLSIHPRKGFPQVVNGLTLGEANRRRLRLSNDGYVGKVVGGG